MGTQLNASHSGPYDFLQEVPLIFYGPGFIRNTGDLEVDREVTLADVAPTFARLMGFEFSTESARPLEEILRPTDKRPKVIFTAMVDDVMSIDLMLDARVRGARRSTSSHSSRPIRYTAVGMRRSLPCRRDSVCDGQVTTLGNCQVYRSVRRARFPEWRISVASTRNTTASAMLVA